MLEGWFYAVYTVKSTSQRYLYNSAISSADKSAVLLDFMLSMNNLGIKIAYRDSISRFYTYSIILITQFLHGLSDAVLISFRLKVCDNRE